MTVFRWRAIVPLILFLVLLGVAWWLLLDRIAERAVEETGASLVGARVDLDAADVRLREGAVILRGLQVANPDAPMTNLVEAREIVANIRVGPLLEEKVVVETLAVRGVRFGTPRETSGELAERSPETGRIWRQVSGWAEAIRVPSLSLEGLGGVVDVDAIRPESLRTLRQARGTVALADSLREGWEARVRRLDPRPRIDSARALLERVRAADPGRLGITGMMQLAGSVRGTVETLGDLRGQVEEVHAAVRQGTEDLASRVRAFEDAREADMAYARNLLRLPALDAPSVSPALFGETAIAWLKPVLYWVRLVERYLPPGLDPARRPGPRRARAAGVTVAFPGRATYPGFLLQYGEADLELGGTGAAAGRYAARIVGLASEPAVYGRPLEIVASRAEGMRGPRDVRLAAILAHAEEPIRDSVALSIAGLSLPTVDLGAAGGRLDLGHGSTRFSLVRRGDSLAVHLRWVSEDVRWERATPPDTAAAARIGTEAWARDLLWRTLSGIGRVEVDMRLRGSVERPALAVSTNLAEAVAQSLRRELGREIERAEAQVRVEVNRLVEPRIAEARERLRAIERDLLVPVAAQLEEIDRLRRELEGQLRRLL